MYSMTFILTQNVCIFFFCYFLSPRKPLINSRQAFLSVDVFCIFLHVCLRFTSLCALGHHFFFLVCFMSPFIFPNVPEKDLFYQQVFSRCVPSAPTSCPHLLICWHWLSSTHKLHMSDSVIPFQFFYSAQVPNNECLQCLSHCCNLPPCFWHMQQYQFGARVGYSKVGARFDFQNFSGALNAAIVFFFFFYSYWNTSIPFSLPAWLSKYVCDCIFEVRFHQERSLPLSLWILKILFNINLFTLEI